MPQRRHLISILAAIACAALLNNSALHLPQRIAFSPFITVQGFPFMPAPGPLGWRRGD
jgi:hypothetical protein